LYTAENFKLRVLFLPPSLPQCGIYPQGTGGHRTAEELLAVESGLQQKQLRAEQGCREVARAGE